MVAAARGVLPPGHRVPQPGADRRGVGRLPDEPEPGDMVNHSCDPNCGLTGQIVVVALRPIEVGVQLTFDYAMCDGYPEVLFDCECGSTSCRGQVTGDDWRIPELQSRYCGYFSPYLERRMR